MSKFWSRFVISWLIELVALHNNHALTLDHRWTEMSNILTRPCFCEYFWRTCTVLRIISGWRIRKFSALKGISSTTSFQNHNLDQNPCETREAKAVSEDFIFIELVTGSARADPPEVVSRWRRWASPGRESWKPQEQQWRSCCTRRQSRVLPLDRSSGLLCENRRLSRSQALERYSSWDDDNKQHEQNWAFQNKSVWCWLPLVECKTITKRNSVVFSFEDEPINVQIFKIYFFDRSKWPN